MKSSGPSLFRTFQRPRTGCGPSPDFIQEQRCGEQRSVQQGLSVPSKRTPLVSEWQLEEETVERFAHPPHLLPASPLFALTQLLLSESPDVEMNQCHKGSVAGPAPSCLTMALPVVGFLLTLTSLAAASAPDCTDLVKPFIPEDPKSVFGKWVYVLGAGDPMPYHKALESLKSSWIDLTPTSSDLVVTLRWGDHCFNRCIFGEVNATISGLTTTFRKNLSDHKGQILQTCSDCLLWTDTFQNQDVVGRYILQFTRTGQIDPKDVDKFKKQAECLNFPNNFHSYDRETDLCPDVKDTTE